ncbi:MAG: hypothetical protein MJK08_05775 [Campylobacterales bacterium]|nr:hypothetical protein [Campylobacterales bacterium]
MKKFIISIVMLMALSASSLNAKNEGNKLTLVKENHAELTFKGVKYILNSYIVILKNPYYLTLEREDNAPIKYQATIETSIDYIKPRGCTSPLKRLPNLDRHSEDNTKGMIGISC